MALQAAEFRRRLGAPEAGPDTPDGATLGLDCRCETIGAPASHLPMPTTFSGAARTMQIHADFSRPASVAAAAQHWVASPQAGVDRVMLDRVGAEKARATSLVRYAPNSQFPPHTHPDGEEILVLDGVFSDETGDYPAGWYLRNPPESAHRPASREGALIFVKLRQMSPDDLATVRIDTRDVSTWQRDERGVECCPLHRHAIEQVDLLRLPAGHPVIDAPVEGLELLVLDGTLHVDGAGFPPHSWIRRPAGLHSDLVAGPDGALVYRKLGEARADRVTTAG